MYDYQNKKNNLNLMNRYMLARTLSMFSYEGLPSTLPATQIEKQLQKNGYTFITMVDNELYAFSGGMGGEPNPYGEPTTITISNPSLKYNETLNIETDGVLIKNDDMMIGLLELYKKYNTLLIENEVTMFLNSFNTRIQTLLSAGDDSTKESAELYLKKIVEGELGIIGENRLFEGISVKNATSNNANATTQLIEFNQYLKATLYNEVGLNANFNMKRERLNSSEVDMNTDNLHPLIDNMLENRVRGIEKLNEMYGLPIAVEFGSIWQTRNKMKEEDSSLESVEPTLEQDEPILEQDEPILESDEPILEQDEPILEDEEIEEAYEINELIDELEEENESAATLEEGEEDDVQ